MCALLSSTGEALLTRRPKTLGTTHYRITPLSKFTRTHVGAPSRAVFRAQTAPCISDRQLGALRTRSLHIKVRLSASNVSAVRFLTPRRALSTSLPRQRFVVIVSAAASVPSGKDSQPSRMRNIVFGCCIVAACVAAGVWIGASFDYATRVQVLLAKVRG
eukprot:9467531-Pyramimonas_sp.AAC.1